MILKVIHDKGFFSCCNVKLFSLIHFFNQYKSIPKTIDCHKQFSLYKPIGFKGDITNHFFLEQPYQNIYYVSNIIIKNPFLNGEDQFSDYRMLPHETIYPFLKKYFSPSNEILAIQLYLLKQYSIQTNNCLALYYRGTDKYKETELGDFSIYNEKVTEIKEKNPGIQLLLQTDSIQMYQYIQKHHSDVIIIKENPMSEKNIGLHFERSHNQNYQDIKYLFATFLIMSQCKYFVCSSGNCSLWMTYYRGHSENIYQWYQNEFYNKG